MQTYVYPLEFGVLVNEKFHKNASVSFNIKATLHPVLDDNGEDDYLCKVSMADEASGLFLRAVPFLENEVIQRWDELNARVPLEWKAVAALRIRKEKKAARLAKRAEKAAAPVKIGPRTKNVSAEAMEAAKESLRQRMAEMGILL